MHPELLSALAAERRRDLDSAMTVRAAAPRGRAALAAGHRARPVLPRFRLSWTSARLAAISGSERGGSVVIVISATRTS
jgi:hypothetical protein